MKRVIALASFFSTVLAAPLSAEKIVREISWSALKAEGRLASGALVGILASRGQARTVVLGLLKGMFAFGVAALIAAVAGWWRAQPPVLLSTLLLLGILCTALPASLLARVRRQYEEKEFRRMRALDAR